MNMILQTTQHKQPWNATIYGNKDGGHSGEKIREEVVAKGTGILYGGHAGCQGEKRRP
jgi:hypothetical protein